MKNLKGNTKVTLQEQYYIGIIMELAFLIYIRRII